MGQQKDSLAQPLDILVGTPQKLVQHAEKGHLYWGDVQYVVLDEADTMFDKGFGPEVKAVLGPLRSKTHPANTILVVATLSQVHRASSALACSSGSACALYVVRSCLGVRTSQEMFLKVRIVHLSTIHRFCRCMEGNFPYNPLKVAVAKTVNK